MGTYALIDVCSLKDSTCKVLMCLLANDKPQDFPSLLQQTNKSEPTLRNALTQLHELGVLIHRRGRYSVDRGKIFSPQQKFFTIGGDDLFSTESDLGTEQYHQCEKIFRAIKDRNGNSIRGNVFDWLCESTTPNIAEAWAKWIPKADKEIDNPIGFMVNCLRANSNQLPPISTQHSLLDLKYNWMIHGNPEHAEYCRSHPGEFDCECGDSEND